MEGRVESEGHPPAEIDLIRQRWRRWRASQGLLDPGAEGFGAGGLGKLIHSPATRLLIIPADPEASLIEFDPEFWDWWSQDGEDPATGGSTGWGPDRRPTVAAAVIGRDFLEGGWRRYLALHRDGALELGLGREASWEAGSHRVFALTTIVARVWAALARYGDVLAHYTPNGPFEVSLAMPGTADGSLANFGEGWAEPGQGLGEDRRCAEANLLLRRELGRWPDSPPELQALARSLGAQIEDAWGHRERRFLAYRGEYEGQLDPRAVGRWQ